MARRQKGYIMLLWSFVGDGWSLRGWESSRGRRVVESLDRWTKRSYLLQWARGLGGFWRGSEDRWMGAAMSDSNPRLLARAAALFPVGTGVTGSQQG